MSRKCTRFPLERTTMLAVFIKNRQVNAGFFFTRRADEKNGKGWG
jgi:hypothetical protein